MNMLLGSSAIGSGKIHKAEMQAAVYQATALAQVKRFIIIDKSTQI